MAFGIGRAFKKLVSSEQAQEFEYQGDNIAVRKKNLSFLSDPEFSRAWDQAVEGNKPAWGGRYKDVRWRAHTAVWAAKHGLALEGDFVECGVFLGLLSLTICHQLDFSRVNKTFYLFDTFNGIPDDGQEYVRRQNKIYFDCYDVAKKNFEPFPNAVLVKGELPGTLENVSIRKISYLSIDLNHAKFEYEVIVRLWDKLSSSAIVLIDDYAFRGNEEQFKMWNEFAQSKGCSILTVPTGSGVLIKP